MADGRSQIIAADNHRGFRRGQPKIGAQLNEPGLVVQARDGVERRCEQRCGDLVGVPGQEKAVLVGRHHKVNAALPHDLGDVLRILDRVRRRCRGDMKLVHGVGVHRRGQLKAVNHVDPARALVERPHDPRGRVKAPAGHQDMPVATHVDRAFRRAGPRQRAWLVRSTIGQAGLPTSRCLGSEPSWDTRVLRAVDGIGSRIAANAPNGAC